MLGSPLPAILIFLAVLTVMWFQRVVTDVGRNGPSEIHAVCLQMRYSSNATLTPDGKYVVYAEREVNGETLWLKQVATGSQTRIAPRAKGRISGIVGHAGQ
jgi:hypothetical protein